MFLPESFASGKAYSEAKAAQIDEEVARFVEEAHQRVLKILSERRNVLDDLAHLLSEKESVQGEELRKMLSESTPGMTTTSPGRPSWKYVGPEAEERKLGEGHCRGAYRAPSALLILIWKGDILMAGKPIYNELERKIKQLEKEVLEYVRKAKELNKEWKVTEWSHIRRTISLMHINEELNREIKELKRSDTEELGLDSHRLRERIKELNCLYDISAFRDATDFSLDAVLQAVVDFIPPAIQYPEITCARLIFGDYEVTTKNFIDTRWKHIFFGSPLHAWWLRDLVLYLSAFDSTENLVI